MPGHLSRAELAALGLHLQECEASTGMAYEQIRDAPMPRGRGYLSDGATCGTEGGANGLSGTVGLVHFTTMSQRSLQVQQTYAPLRTNRAEQCCLHQSHIPASKPSGTHCMYGIAQTLMRLDRLTPHRQVSQMADRASHYRRVWLIQGRPEATRRSPPLPYVRQSQPLPGSPYRIPGDSEASRGLMEAFEGQICGDDVGVGHGRDSLMSTPMHHEFMDTLGPPLVLAALAMVANSSSVGRNWRCRYLGRGALVMRPLWSQRKCKSRLCRHPLLVYHGSVSLRKLKKFMPLPQWWADAYWARVDRSGGPDACWPWTGNPSRPTDGCAGGYGHVSIAKITGQTCNVAAHVPALLLTVGWYPGRKKVGRHLCHNRICCNPSHLAWGSKQDNSDDMVRAGRAATVHIRGDAALARFATDGNEEADWTDDNYIVHAGRLRECTACDGRGIDGHVMNLQPRDSWTARVTIRGGLVAMFDCEVCGGSGIAGITMARVDENFGEADDSAWTALKMGVY